MKIKLSILVGGTSYEREISLNSGKEILKNLNKDKYDVTVIEIPENNSSFWIRDIIEAKPQVILLALHGGFGENGSVQGLLECLNIPYVGSKVMASSICMDKAMSKVIMKANHIPVPEDIFIPMNDSLIKFEEKIEELGFPLIVKPNKGGSSLGITIVRDKTEILPAIELVKQYKDDILIEKYIEGREVTCGVVETEHGLDVLTILDIETKNKFYDYEAKYTESVSKIEFSKLPFFLQTMINEIAKKVFLVLNCSGYGRVDMIVREEQVYVLEMNTLPGLTSHSLIPKAAKGEDTSFSDFLDKIILFAFRGGRIKI